MLDTVSIFSSKTAVNTIKAPLTSCAVSFWYSGGGGGGGIGTDFKLYGEYGTY